MIDRRRITVCTGTLASIILATPLLAQSAQVVAKKAFTSTVLLVMEDGEGRPVSLGSGFFVKNGVIATNVHVAEGAARGYAKIVGQPTKYDIKGVLAADPTRDLLLLQIAYGKSPILPLGNSDTLEVGETVYAVGNPQGLEGTFSQGIVSSIRQIGSEKLLQITAPISPGSSGGPVLNSRGDVVGVSVATYKGGQNLNFAIPVNALKSLMQSSGALRPLSPTKRAPSERSIVDHLGGKSTDGVVGTSFAFDGFAQLGYFSLSLANKLRDSVRDVQCLVIFYDKQENPIDVAVVNYPGVIPAGLARRVTGHVEGSVQKLVESEGAFRSIVGKIEFRVLNFVIVNQ
ncbi:MAG: trypsin-like peptidase domain-containing protein [Gemmatimonadaceae bacterium]|nr:trypsin-like peptidase domain-containing protein [Gemmatimonadaceae bacterium]